MTYNSFMVVGHLEKVSIWGFPEDGEWWKVTDGLWSLGSKGGSCDGENSGSSSAAEVGPSGGRGGEVGIRGPKVLRGWWRDGWVGGSQVGKSFAGGCACVKRCAVEFWMYCSILSWMVNLKRGGYCSRQVQEVMEAWIRGFPAGKERSGRTSTMLLGWIHWWRVIDERFWTVDLSQNRNTINSSKQM